MLEKNCETAAHSPILLKSMDHLSEFFSDWELPHKWDLNFQGLDIFQEEDYQGLNHFEEDMMEANHPHISWAGLSGMTIPAVMCWIPPYIVVQVTTATAPTISETSGTAR